MSTIKIADVCRKSDGSLVYVYAIPFKKVKVDSLFGTAKETESFVYVAIIDGKFVPMKSTSKLSSVPLGQSSLKGMKGLYWYMYHKNNEKFGKFCTSAKIPASVKASEIALFLLNSYVSIPYTHEQLLALCKTVRLADLRKRIKITNTSANTGTNASDNGASDNRDDLQGVEF